MSHHYSGPDFGFPRGDARLDFTDLYAFPKPGNTSKSILVMNVHPSAVASPPSPTTPEPFAPEDLRVQDRHERRCGRRYRIPGAILALRERVANRHAVARARCRGRRDRRRRPGYRRISTGLNGSRGTRDGGRRVSLLRGLAQRSLLLRRARHVEPPTVHRRRFLR